MDQILERLGLKYEDLTSSEKETLNGWLDNLEKSKVTIDTIKAHVSAMREAVERELTKTDHNSKQDIFLKARLRNYLLLEAFLTNPEKAKEAIDRALAGMVNDRSKVGE